jgi:Uncharacterized protein conserved in bacteria
VGEKGAGDVRKKRALWLLVGIATGAAIVTPRRWLTTNDVTTGCTPEYPEIEPREYALEPRDVFEAVRHAVRRMARWKVVREDLPHMRLDAEVKTFLFRFTDDVTVWTEESPRGSRVMIRAHSRIGRGDLGENARTIRALQRAIDEEVGNLHRPGNVGHPEAGVEVLPAGEGAGPLLQRDYTGVIVGSTWSPVRIMHMVRSDIERFSAPELATFIRPPHDSAPLEIGDSIEVHIKGAGESHVRTVHSDERSLTLRTMDDHPEAGRITFGSWRDQDDNLVFQIRSRARQSNRFWLAGFLLGGKALQTKIWETFIERVAEAAGGRLKDGVEVKTKEVTDTAADKGEVDSPTLAVPPA